MASDTNGSIPRFNKANAPMLRLKGINKLKVSPSIMKDLPI